MKDIKELIYAAVEENALKFQELVNNQLQVRAYDAIEALRPEVGASMFGESSHKKMDDEDEEDMEDMEDEEDEDEDEDEKKSKVEEELKGNQHKIDKNKNGKIDGHDFKLLRKEEVEQINELKPETYRKLAAARHGRADYAVDKSIELRGSKEGEAHWDKSQKDRSVAFKAARKAGVPTYKTGPHTHTDSIKSTKYDPNKNPRDSRHFKPVGEEVEQFDEKVKIFQRDQNPQGDTVGTPVRYPKGHSAHGDAHRAIVAKAAKASRREGSLKGSDKSTWRRQFDNHQLHAGKEVGEEVEQINELKPETYRKLAVARDARARHFSGIAQHPYNRGSSDETRFNKLADRDRAVAKKAADKAGVSHSDISHGNYDYITNKVKEEVEQKNIFRNPKLSAKDQLKNPPKQIKVKEDVNEVAMPKNAADWQAMINHQIKVTGHPVATDAQFRATHGKDTSKIASQHSPEDMLNYATAQGGTVKQ